jgi:hypothetical protein
MIFFTLLGTLVATLEAQHAGPVPGDYGNVTDINVGVETCRTLAAQTNDLQRFVGKQGEWYDVRTKSKKDEGAGIDTLLRIYKRDPRQHDDPPVAENDDYIDSGQTKRASKIEYFVPTDGDYYVQVTNRQLTTITYCLNINFLAETNNFKTDSCEPNDSFSAACLLNQASTPTPTTSITLTPQEAPAHNFLPVSGLGPDQDYFQFWAKEGWTYNCTTQIHMSGGDTYMQLFTYDRTVVAVDSMGGSRPDAVGSLITYTPSADGWLYLLVQPPANLPINQGQNFEYTLQCVGNAANTHVDDCEPSDSFDDACPLGRVSGTAIDHTKPITFRPLSNDGKEITNTNFVPLSGAGVDRDYFKLLAKQGWKYDCQVQVTSLGIDTKLTLFNQQRDIVGQSADHANRPTLYSNQLTYTAVADGWLYLLVEPEPSNIEPNSRYTLHCTGSAEFATPDRCEPNNNRAAACLLKTDQTSVSDSVTLTSGHDSHNFVPIAGTVPDEDYYRFWARQQWEYTCTTTIITTSKDTHMTLQNEWGAVFATDQNRSEIGSQLVYTATQNGWLYLHIKPEPFESFLTNGVYDYTLSCAGEYKPIPTPEPIQLSSCEPNDTFDAACELEVEDSSVAGKGVDYTPKSGLTFTANPPLQTDRDYFKFVAIKGWEYDCQTTNLSFGNDTSMQFFNQQRNIVASDDGVGGQATLVGSHIKYTARADGWLYILVEPDTVIPAGQEAAFTYELQCRGEVVPPVQGLPPVPTLMTAEKECSTDNDLLSIDTACKLDITADARQGNFLSKSGRTKDKDFFYFWGQAGQTYRCETRIPGGSEFNDTRLSLFDGNGKLLKSNLDAPDKDSTSDAPFLDSVITQTVWIDQWLFVLVEPEPQLQIAYSKAADYEYELQCKNVTAIVRAMQDLKTTSTPTAPAPTPTTGSSVANPTIQVTHELLAFRPKPTPFTPIDAAFTLFIYFDTNNNGRKDGAEGIVNMPLYLVDNATGQSVVETATNVHGATHLSVATTARVDLVIPFLQFRQSLSLDTISSVQIRIAPQENG